VGAGGTDTVLVAQSLDEADQRTSQAIELSTVIGAASVAMVAAVAWLAVGRTLRRVERLRARVCAVTASGDLERWVPQSGADELAGLGATLNEMLAALARASDRQRRFVADAAHELRTPIAGLNASIDVAARHPHLARDPAWLGELSDAHRRLGRLVEDLLVLARLDEHAPHRRGPVELAGLVTDAARRRTPDAVRIEVSPLAPATVLGDETQLDRILTNLIDNAVRHARSAVHIALTTRDGEAVITVTDDGPGVPAPDRDRIWERFTRLDDARSRGGGGTGLGLALVKELTQAHGGTTHVTDAATHTGGAAFHIHIPLHP
jgi:signal transduction histidine kinase